MAQRMPSLELIWDSFDRERDRDLAHFDSSDTKAGVVLGFAGVLVAIVGQHATVLSVLVRVSATAAAVSALLAFWPRRFPAIDYERLREYVTSEQAITRLAMIDTYLGMLEEGRHLTQLKARRLKVAMLSLAVAAAVAGTSFAGGLGA